MQLECAIKVTKAKSVSSEATEKNKGSANLLKGNRKHKSGGRATNVEHTFSEQNWGSATSSYFQLVANRESHALQEIVRLAYGVLQDDLDGNSGMDDQANDSLEGEIDACALMLAVFLQWASPYQAIPTTLPPTNFSHSQSHGKLNVEPSCQRLLFAFPHLLPQAAGLHNGFESEAMKLPTSHFSWEGCAVVLALPFVSAPTQVPYAVATYDEYATSLTFSIGAMTFPQAILSSRNSLLMLCDKRSGETLLAYYIVQCSMVRLDLRKRLIFNNSQTRNPLSFPHTRRDTVPQSDREMSGTTEGLNDGEDEDERAGIVDKQPVLAHSEVKLARCHDR
ncbi:hypothetical protein EDD15DRAFT_2206799 [Pisolithus albus]|nr:hypothetical protein EDD15DRAFT_2206799 [Pisolithus albus]